MQATEKASFVEAVGLFVVEQIKSATEPLVSKIAALEQRLAAAESRPTEDQVKSLIMKRILGALADFDDVVSKCGDNTRAQISAAVEEIKSLIPTAVSGKDGADGKDGKDGADGKDGKSVTKEDVMPELLEMCKEWAVGTVFKCFEDNPVRDGKDGADGKDGRDGRDGTNGADGASVDLDTVRTMVDSAVAELPVPRHVVSGHVDRGGCLRHVLSDGSLLELGVVVGRDGTDGKDGVPGKDGRDGTDGKDGAPGKDGLDGLGFKDLSVVLENDRDLVLMFENEEQKKQFELTFPVQIYRGTWKAGSYRRGDQVSRDGSQWTATRDTDGVPSTIDSGWVLSVKRGQNGRDGKDGDRGPPGPDGKPGRDLTQIGPDGKKWG